MRKLFPVILALFGLAGGAGAGLFLRPAPVDAPEGEAAPEQGEVHAADGDHDEADTAEPEFVRLSNQFVVPVVAEGRVSAMVVLSLSLEVETGTTDAVFQREPKLRDAFLQVLFDHANLGGFSGSFTDGSNLVLLRTALKETAVQVLGPVVKDVLITDIARQDS
jgi:hypothetical protein